MAIADVAVSTTAKEEASVLPKNKQPQNLFLRIYLNYHYDSA